MAAYKASGQSARFWCIADKPDLAQLSARQAKEPANTGFSLSCWSLQSSCRVGYLLARQLLNV